MFSIGEFSRITGLTVKSLRLYHEKGILVPHTVDEITGYRHYDHRNVEQAYLIKQLREMEFSLEDIAEILSADAAPEDILKTFQNQKETLQDKIFHYNKAISALETVIKSEQEAQIMSQEQAYEVTEKTVGDQLIAGIRFKGKYCDCGQYFGQMGRKLGWLISGSAFNLYYDPEYKENDADIEACFPIRKEKAVDGVNIRTLPGGRCISLIHKGPYDQLGRSYEKILAYAKEKGYCLQTPSREIYLKGPGMIFKGNPKNYLTEIQIMLNE